MMGIHLLVIDYTGKLSNLIERKKVNKTEVFPFQSLALDGKQWPQISRNFIKLKYVDSPFHFGFEVCYQGLRNRNDFFLANGRTTFYAARSAVNLLLEGKLNQMPFPFLRNFGRLSLPNHYGFVFD